MSKTGYIIFNNYFDFKNYENILMSLIVGLHRSGKSICFSNGYAAVKCGVSTRTITDTLKRFVDEGFISIHFLKGNYRIIKLLKTPLIYEDTEECGIENNSTPIEESSTPIEESSIPIELGSTPIEHTSNNNIDNNKDYNTQHTTNEILIEWKEDKRFCKVASMFPENKLKEVKRAYDYFWLFLPENDKLEIERTLPTYIQRNQSNKNYIKQIDKYFESRFWITDETTLSLLKPKQVQPKRFIF